MENYEKSLEDLKIKLYRLHFLLTEKQTPESISETLKHFTICFEHAFDCLAMYFKNEKDTILKSPSEVIAASLKQQLFNQQTIEILTTMAQDYEQVKKAEDSGLINSIADPYARLLQMIYDMLVGMGKDPLDDDNE